MAKRVSSSAAGDASVSVAEIAALGGKMPPQALEFEEAVLGAIMLDKDALQNVVEVLKPEHFYVDAHQRIYGAMLRLNSQMAPIDMLTISEELKKTGELEAVGGRAYVAKLTSKVGAAVNIEYHARIIFRSICNDRLFTWVATLFRVATTRVRMWRNLWRRLRMICLRCRREV